MVVFIFDNSFNHTAFSKNTLIESQINLNSDRKQLFMQNTCFKPNNQT
jgi:hypothetical protein